MRVPLRSSAPLDLPDSDSAVLTFGRLAPISSASSLCDIGRSIVDAAFLAAGRLRARGGEEEAREPAFDRVQRDRLELLVGFAHARAQEAHGGLGR